MANKNDLDFSLLKATQEVNLQQAGFVFQKILGYFNELSARTIAIWGLAFKPGTDDVREAPAIRIVRYLLDYGAVVRVHDPQAMERFADEFGVNSQLQFAANAYDALTDADALVLLTEWNEYRWPNWNRISALLKDKVVFDFRNQYDAGSLMKLGFHYQCIGRPDSVNTKR
jgi:UDPglucose 6-dehydrogenase